MSTPSPQVAPATRLLVALLALLATGCAVPVAASLDEGDANRVVVALHHATVGASKEQDPQVEGKYRVVVARDETAHALAVLQEEGLPRPHAPGVLDALGKGSLVPSLAAEHAHYVAGLGGELERSLDAVEGVVTSRVHLNLPAPNGGLALGGEAAAPRPTASVLLEHRGTTPPLPEAAVQRLVAFGVAGLAPADVAVVFVARPAPPRGPELAQVGPIAVAPGSASLLKWTLGGLLALLAVSAGALLVTYDRRRRALS